MPLPPPRVIESIFLQYGTLKNYPANKTIFVKGDVADKIAFIKSGRASTRSRYKSRWRRNNSILYGKGKYLWF